MKKLFLLLTIIGTLLPNIFVALESIESRNFLLYRFPIDTFNAMFVNNVTSAFITDLLFIVILFMIWTYKIMSNDRTKMLFIWIYTFAFGIAGGLPLFLYFREDAIKLKN